MAEIEPDDGISIIRNRTFVLSLVLGNLVSAFPILITSMLLIEISQSFNVEVGIANQVRAIESSAAVLMGLLMSGLAVRYRQKSLYLFGLAFLCLSARAQKET